MKNYWKQGMKKSEYYRLLKKSGEIVHKESGKNKIKCSFDGKWFSSAHWKNVTCAKCLKEKDFYVSQGCAESLLHQPC